MAAISREQLTDLVYWRDPKRTGLVLTGLLVILISLATMSLISVISYASLVALSASVSFRLYKNVLQAVQKNQEGHPFQEYLDMDLAIPQDKVHESADCFISHLKSAFSELRRLFLVEDLVDSIKFGLLLWSLTYIGSWFNGITLIILGVVGLFTLPKVYETHQEKIDQNLNLIKGKMNETWEKVHAIMPIGKKPKSQ